MPVLVLALALAVFVFALIAAPAFRAWGLGAAAAICVGLGIWLLVSGRTAPVDRPVIPPAELSLDQLSLERVGRGATLTGRVLNGSPDWRLREMELALRLRDCVDESVETAGCPVIGEATAVARPDTPPGQIRGFTALFAFPNVPPVSGVLRWDWEIVDTRATP